MDKDPDIVFVTRKWAPAVGGMETYSHRLSEALADILPVEVIALAGRADGMPPTFARLLAFPLTIFRKMIARNRGPKVLHLADMALWPIGLLAGRHTCLAISAHGTDVSYHRRGGIRGTLYGAYLRLGARLLRRARVIANSRATAAVLKETGWHASAIIPLATDLTAPAPDGTHDGSILYAGRLIERKGCGWFVQEVLPLLPSEIRLKIAGTNWDEREFLVLKNSRVDFLGPLSGDALANAYRKAMCVIVPNISVNSGEYEGFGLVACEAAACGGMVLAAKTGGLADAVIDGVTGKLVTSGDADEWAAELRECAKLSRHQRAVKLSAVRESARAAYSWDRVARQSFAAYGLSAGEAHC